MSIVDRLQMKAQSGMKKNCCNASTLFENKVRIYKTICESERNKNKRKRKKKIMKKNYWNDLWMPTSVKVK